MSRDWERNKITGTKKSDNIAAEYKEPNLKDLLRIRVSDWKRLGQRLGFTSSQELSEIEEYGDQNPRDRYNAIKRKLFGGWKTKYSLQPTNQAIVQALIDVEEHDAAITFCRTHGVNFERCNSADRERLKEPVNSIGNMNMIFHQEAQKTVFLTYLNEDIGWWDTMISALIPQLNDCNWREVLNEIQFSLPNLNFYPSVNLQFRPELYEIAPVIFRGKCMKPDSADIQKILKQINSELNERSLTRSWYLVVFILFYRGGIISLEQYKSLAQECSVPDDEVYRLLDYVHKNFGLLLHYKNIPELKEVVICSSKLVLEECCSLFDVILDRSPDVKQNGLVAKSIIDSICAQGNQRLSIALTLLKHYHFIIEKVLANSVYYFIPLLLNDRRFASSKRIENCPSPVLICFSSSSEDIIPCGIFNSLHGCLAERLHFSSNNYSRMVMGFSVNSFNIVLNSQTKFIELRILADLECVPRETYDLILSHVISALETVSSIYDGVTFDFQFTCPGSRFQQLHKSKPIEDFKLQCCGRPQCHVLKFDCQAQHMVWRRIWNYKRLDVPESMDIDSSIGEASSSIMKLLESQLKEEGGVPFRVCKAVLYGPPGCGKTTVCRRLTGQLSNLSSDPKHAPTSSTGIEDPVTIDLYHTVDQTAVFVGQQQNKWAPQTIQQQVNMLFYYLQMKKNTVTQTLACMSTSNLPQHGIEPMQEIPSSSMSSHIHGGHSTNSIPQLMPSSASEFGTQNSLAFQHAVSSTKHDKELHNKDSVVFKTLKKMVQNKEWQELQDVFAEIEDGTLLSIIDTGGQPEFHDILPLLIRGPSLFLIFLKLIDSLEKTYHVSYRIEENAEGMSYESLYTPRNIIHQVLALCHSLGDEYAAFLIGSYKDKVTEREIEKMEESLQMSLKNSTFLNQDRLKRYDGKHYIYPVDNVYGNTTEIEQLQKLILKTVKKFQSNPKLLPLSWFLLHLMLKYLYQDAKTCELQKAIELALQLNINKDDVPDILEFIDHNFGTILFYRNIPSLQNTVICDPSVVFEPIAKLVGESFGANPDRPTTSESIRRSGLVPISLVDSIRLESNSVIPLESIIEILKEAKVLTEMKENEEILLFMPCLLLPDPSVEDYSSCNLNIPLSFPSPLIFNFTLPSLPSRSAHGFIDVPVGLFNALVIKLSQSSEWVLHREQMFKNRMQFFFCNANPSLVELIAHISFIQVNFIENPNPQKCFQVREEISLEINEIMSSHSHMKNIETKIGFFCPGGDSTSPHPAFFLGGTIESPTYVVCAGNCTSRLHKLEKNHKVWFEVDNQVESMDTQANLPVVLPPNDYIPASLNKFQSNVEIMEAIETADTPILSNEDSTINFCGVFKNHYDSLVTAMGTSCSLSKVARALKSFNLVSQSAVDFVNANRISEPDQCVIRLLKEFTTFLQISKNPLKKHKAMTDFCRVLRDQDSPVLSEMASQLSDELGIR